MYILKACVYKQTPSHMLLGFLQRKQIKSSYLPGTQHCIRLWEFPAPFSRSLKSSWEGKTNTSAKVRHQSKTFVMSQKNDTDNEYFRR